MKAKVWVHVLIAALSVLIVSSVVWAQEQDSEENKLNLNLATLDELKELPGTTEEMAQAIFDNRPYESFVNVLEIDDITEDFIISIEDIAETKVLNINSAKISELKLLPGITVEMAEAIIEARPYEIIEELLKIKGIGEEELVNLQGFIKAAPREEGEEAEDKGWKTRKRDYLGTESTQP